MAEEVLTALQAPLWVRDVSIARHVDEHSKPFVEFEVFVQDLPISTLTALVLPKGNPLVLHLSEFLARDLRKGLERRDAPGTHALPSHDVASRTGAPCVANGRTFDYANSCFRTRNLRRPSWISAQRV